MRTKKVAVIDEHEIFRCGVTTILAEDPWLDVVYAAADGMPDVDVDVIVASPARIRTMQALCPVLICWGPSDPPLIGTHAAAAIVERDELRGDDLVGLVWALSTGLRVQTNGASARAGVEIDNRCRHILRLLSQGADTRGISQSLCYSERTVKGLIRDIEEHLSAANRAEAVAKAIRLGLI